MSLHMLLRSSRTLYTCLVVPIKDKGPKICASLYQQQVHYSNSSLDDLLRSMKQFKMKGPDNQDNLEHEESDSLDEEDQSRLMHGLLEEERVFPNLETHAKIIDGVRYDELPIVHVKATRNNTIVNLTRNGEPLAHSSGGTVGFRNRKKSTVIAAQAISLDVAKKAEAHGIKSVRVVLKGIGPGRLPVVRSLQLLGVNIVSLTDKTYTPFNGNKPPNPRH